MNDHIPIPFVALEPIPAGSLVTPVTYIRERLYCRVADASSQKPAIGFVRQAVARNRIGRAYKIGLLRGTTAAPVNTESAVASALVYLGADGSWTLTPPSTAQLTQRVGIVTKANAVTGEIRFDIGAPEAPSAGTPAAFGSIQRISRRITLADLPAGTPTFPTSLITEPWLDANGDLVGSLARYLVFGGAIELHEAPVGGGSLAQIRAQFGVGDLGATFDVVAITGDIDLIAESAGATYPGWLHAYNKASEFNAGVGISQGVDTAPFVSLSGKEGDNVTDADLDQATQLDVTFHLFTSRAAIP